MGGDPGRVTVPRWVSKAPPRELQNKQRRAAAESSVWRQILGTSRADRQGREPQPGRAAGWAEGGGPASLAGSWGRAGAFSRYPGPKSCARQQARLLLAGILRGSWMDLRKTQEHAKSAG